MIYLILTPVNDENTNELKINQNVLIELGYAFASIDNDNIYIFVDTLTQTEFNNLKPSMLASVKYTSYENYENFIELINEKYDNFEKCNISYNNIILNDKFLLSNIKYDFLKLLNSDINNKIDKIDHFIKNYTSYDVIDIYHKFSEYHIQHNHLDYNYNNYYFHTIYYIQNDIFKNDIWINNNNNQKRIINILKMYIYILFKKCSNKNTKNINKNRKNFALLIFDLLEYDEFKYKEHIKNILFESVEYSKFNNYELYVYKLNGLFDNILYDTKIKKNKYYWEDHILKVKNTYNDWIISH